MNKEQNLFTQAIWTKCVEQSIKNQAKLDRRKKL